MASRKFRFVSPGVFLREIDNSQLPGESTAIGPIIIGRTRKGPGMRPYKIRSLEELERVFGKPMPGNQGSDSWREGTGLLAESYAPYAAKAYLTAGQGTDSPITMVRLLGVTGDDATASDEANPGWKAKSAYGLFLAAVTGSNPNIGVHEDSSFELAAIFYSTDENFSVRVAGKDLSNTAVSGSGKIVKLPVDKKFNIRLADQRGEHLTAGADIKDVVFNFSEIRKKFNTNPVSTNGRISPSAPSGSLQDKYWLGETFDETFNRLDKSLQANADASLAYVVMELDSSLANFKGTNYEATAARTGWVFSQDTTDHPSQVNLESNQKLFRIIALQEGAYASSKLIVGIEDIKVAKEGATNRFGKFSVVVRSIGSTRTEIVERFDNCDLDPNSPDFIAKKIGDQYYKWSPSEKRNKVYGEHPNVSEYIRVEMNQEIVTQGGPTDTESVPFGFYGPVVTKDHAFTVTGSAAINNGWVTGTINAAANGLTSSFSWPKMPLVEQASAAQDYYMGVSPGVFSYTTASIPNQNSAGTRISKAYVDYFRIGSSYNTLQEDQISGIKSTNTKYSFIFSLDDVIITPTERASLIKNIKRAGDVKSVVYSSESRNGDDTITPAVEGVKATVDIEAAGYPNNDEELTVTDSSGKTTTFIFKGGVQTADGSKAGEEIIIGLGGLNSFGDLVDRIVAVFAAARSNEDTNIVASNEGGNPAVTLRLTQGTESGSADANSSLDLDNVNGLSYTNNATTGFSGGVTAVAASKAYPSAHPDRSYTWHLANGRTGSLETLLDIVDGFHMPLVGGFDGVDIRESDPFNAEVINNGTTADSYAYASIDRAIEMIKDPEAVEHNVALMPGISEPSLTTKLVDLCEARADSLAIIDLPDAYIPPFQEHKDTFQQRLPVNGPEDAARDLVSRQINSSYGACYYPWVKIKDEEFNRDVWAPPSVVALGVMAFTERSSEVWFAPAGFNRGGLNAGNAGVPVLQVTEQLLAKDRDTLYAANINPIASFVSEGIVIFGQKTLQSTRSALDRINVRRLLIFVKKEVSRISKDLLFEQNVQATWARFHGQVKTFLSSVKVRFGLTDFKVVLDTTTTTPDLIDRNIMYAKIFLKPARSIEFIAVDFVITNTGASFAD